MISIRFVTCVLLLSGSSAIAAETPADQKVVFSKDIQPLLAKHCLLCHGTDKSESGLRLDTHEFATSLLESENRAIVPGDPQTSELLFRISSSDEFTRMPPEGEPLAADEIELFRRWIEQGAKYERHWSYTPIEKPAVPPVKDNKSVRNPIDNFALAKLEERGISPSPAAAKATLIKRLHYDLIGIPPTPAEVDEFINDTSPQAYEKLVDRLAASKHFGERWGRHWLDKARYADSDGYEKDNPRPNAWRYRDWVIEAINEDLPFDQFTIEQLAGDLLPEATATQKLATAFHRQTLTNTEGGTDQEEFRVEATFDRTETTSAVWMALTMTCARCHSHKYDQITQDEYYQLFAFFNNANEANTEVARSAKALNDYETAKRKHAEQVAALTKKYESARSELQPEIDNWLRDMTSQAKEAVPVEYKPVKFVEDNATDGRILIEQEDGSLLLSGVDAAVDQYAVVIESPDMPFSGFRLETLADERLPGNGPGRTSHGNFVLTHFQVLASDKRSFEGAKTIEFTAADADFSQTNFPPENALSPNKKTGWAISPQMGKDHQISFFTKEPITPKHKYLKIVLDQKYGSQHTIGKFRLTIIEGFDPLRALPKAVAEAVKASAESRTPEQENVIADHVASLHEKTAKLQTQLAKLKSNPPPSPLMNVRVIVPAERETKRLHRGDFLQPAEKVSPGALATIEQVHPLTSRQDGHPPDRLDLAHWLVDEKHPLTSRVVVNQTWAHLFGHGLVRTINDFGVRGEQPTHPELLDWLAWEFPRSMNWSRKQLIKTIVMSATYRQSSAHRPELRELDPTNRLLARQNRVRVEAELIRDLSLAVSGLLTDKVGGPSVFPPLPEGVAELSYANNFKWATSKGADRYRRGMYTFFKRTSPHPTLISFDCPDSNTTKLTRDSSNTPLQALATLNNDVFTEASQAMAKRVLSEGGNSDAAKLNYALRLCLVRTPTETEVARFQKLLEESRAYYQSHAEDAKLVTKQHAVPNITPAENAAWITTLRMILNLDEFIVRD